MDSKLRRLPKKEINNSKSQKSIIEEVPINDDYLLISGCRGDDVSICSKVSQIKLPSRSPSQMSEMSTFSAFEGELKKFSSGKSQMDRNEESVFTLTGRAEMPMDQITKETSEENPSDNDLCEMLNFGGTWSKDNDLAIDLVVYKDILNEIDGTWRNLIYEISGCKKEAIKSSSQDLKMIPGIPVAMQKSIRSTQNHINAKKGNFLKNLRKDLAILREKIKTTQTELDSCKNLIRDKDDYIVRLEEKEAGARAIQDRLEKTCGTFTEECALKNKEIEKLNQDLDQVEQLNRELEEKLKCQENEYKKSLSVLTKEYELTCARLERSEKPYQEMHEKLLYIQMREDNLRKWSIDSIPLEAQELLSKIKAKSTVEEKSCIDALVRIIENQEEKIDAYTRTDKNVKEKLAHLETWENELSLREKVVFGQNRVSLVRNRLLEMVENNEELCTEVARGTADLLCLKITQVKEMLRKMRIDGFGSST